MQSNDATIWFALLVSRDGAKEAQRQQRNAGAELRDLDESLRVQEGERELFFAGSIGLLNAAANNAVCEIGHVSLASSSPNWLPP